MATSAFAKEFRTERGIVFAEPDGRRLKATLYCPADHQFGDSEAVKAGRKPLPGMVLIHGGGWIIGSRHQQAWYCRAFAKAGYVVMTIEYRMMPKYCFPECVYDCKAAVRWMRLRADWLGVDPSRIVAFGASAGGHLAAFLATTGPEDGFEGTENPGPSTEVSAVISLYGAVDLTKYRDEPLEGALRSHGLNYLAKFAGAQDGATGEGNPDPLVAASPITYADSTTCPIIFVHGTSDFMVPFSQSKAFHDRLTDLGVPTRLIAMPHRNHGFDYIHVKERRRVFREMLAFLDEHNGPRNP